MSKGSIRRQYSRVKIVDQVKVKDEQTEKHKTRVAAALKKKVKEGIMTASQKPVETKPEPEVETEDGIESGDKSE